MGDSDTLMELSPRSSPVESESKAHPSEQEQPVIESKKRSIPEESDEKQEAEPVAKRRRTEDYGLQTPPAEDVVTAVMDARPAFNDEPSHLLRRGTALVLEHIGFDGATKEALEAFCGEVDAYATNFLSHVTTSMLSARRSVPIPPDFEYALRCEGLTARLLKPHLKPPIPIDKITQHFSIVPQREPVYHRAADLLGEELDGESDKLTKVYIPKRFPSFPSKHTYKSTEVKLERETDPRKIREKATEEARHGEEALRRLVKVGKSGDQKYARKGMGNAAKPQRRHEMWEEAMKDLANDRPPSRSFGGGDGTDEQSILVNAEKPYTRRPALRRKVLV